MKNILIGGCSFSEYIEGRSYPWISWSKLLSYNNNIRINNTALSSYGQPKISESITTELLKNTYDLVILQWSGVSRGYKLNEIPSLNDILELQNKIGNKEQVHEIIEGIADINHIGYVKRSLIQIYLLQHFLETSNIPYISFWGWNQIDDVTLEDDDVLELTKKIYNDNWILKNKNNGFADEFGANLLLEDFHPNSKCHFNFYQKIKLEIEKRLYIQLDSNIL